MSEFELYMDYSGLDELRNSSGVVDCLQKHANEIKGRCSGNYETSQHIGPHRANVSIYTTDRKTYFKNLKDNELAKALRG